LSKPWITLKAIWELGPYQTGQYGLYRLGLHSGLLHWRTQAALRTASSVSTGSFELSFLPEPDLPKLGTLIQPEDRTALLRTCEEICSGTARIFAGQAAPIVTLHPTSQQDWSAVREGALAEDVKFIWEPARFGWALQLAQAYRLTGDELYPQAFWSLSERFFQANPPYQGVQWASAQEVAMRLMALALAARLFGASAALDGPHQGTLSRWMAIHAARIPPTLAYARAQNNNHLLSEAAGLLTAGAALPEHPQASGWRSLGWRLLEQGLVSQIAESGEYVQHSANYHRLMLQIALWAALVGATHGYRWAEPVSKRIQAAIRWLAALIDPATGRAPNLGPNDSADLLPLSGRPAGDFRPVLQAAGRHFLGRPLFPAGAWDDLSAWLGIRERESSPVPSTPQSPIQTSGGQGVILDVGELNPLAPLTLHHPRHESWCYLRAARFTARPGHADQLHLDLWWRGENIALDPGTFRYNAPPPWENALTHTAVHNTLMLENQEQMARAGRFLYLDRAQAEVLMRAGDHIAGRHNGYRGLGLAHQRSVLATPWGWRVEDLVTPLRFRLSVRPIAARLHWLAPDWPWKLEQTGDRIQFALESPHETIYVQILARGTRQPSPPDLKPFAVRAGKTLIGEIRDQPTWGWNSPAYGLKYPALAFGVQLVWRPPFTLVTEWRF
jgi:hypothetical protein